MEKKNVFEKWLNVFFSFFLIEVHLRSVASDEPEVDQQLRQLKMEFYIKFLRGSARRHERLEG